MDYIELIKKKHTASLEILSDMIENPKKNIPNMAKLSSGKQSSCEIPDVENGFVEDVIFGQKFSSGDMVPVDFTQVLVKCNTGFDLQNLERNQPRNCKSYGWDDEIFPKCQSNI